MSCLKLKKYNNINNTVIYNNIIILLFKIIFYEKRYCLIPLRQADAGGSAVYAVRLQPLVCWARGFKSRCTYACACLVFVAC